MMKRIIPQCLLCCLALSSCDQVKNIAVQAKEAVEEKVAGETVVRSTEPDAELQALVDQTEEGYVFRKDLPFPTHLRVKTVKEWQFKGRLFRSSAFGNESSEVDGTFHYESEITSDGHRATISHKDTRFTPAKVTDSKEIPESKVMNEGGTISMERGKGGWVPAKDGKALDFSRAAKLVGGGFQEELTDNGLLPRPFWFGKKRMKTGDSVTLDGKHLEVLMPPGSDGKLSLKLESVEAVNGHPCGVFSVEGSVTVPSEGMFSSPAGREDLTFESAKVWLSLIHPLVLRTDIQAVVSSRKGSGKGNMEVNQGISRTKVEREWEIVSGDGK